MSNVNDRKAVDSSKRVIHSAGHCRPPFDNIGLPLHRSKPTTTGTEKEVLATIPTPADTEIHGQDVYQYGNRGCCAASSFQHNLSGQCEHLTG
jgi:hypothetical protein